MGLVVMAMAAAMMIAQPAAGEPGSLGLELFIKSDAALFQSPARTAGGAGAALGIRRAFESGLFVHAEASYLLALGNTLGFRLGVGYQLPGFYSPAVLVAASALIGGGLRFVTPEHRTPVWWPAFSAGVTLAPLRFARGAARVSVLELGVELGSDFPGLATCFRLSILEIGLAF